MNQKFDMIALIRNMQLNFFDPWQYLAKDG